MSRFAPDRRKRTLINADNSPQSALPSYRFLVCTNRFRMEAARRGVSYQVAAMQAYQGWIDRAPRIRV